MRHHRGKQHGVSWSVGLAAEPLEGAAEIAEFLLLAPGQQPVPLESGHAELLDRGAVLARQRFERILAQLFRPEVDEVIRIFFPSKHAKEIRIDHPQHHFVLVLQEERLELGRQQLDGARHDVAMRGAAPREGR